MLFVIRWSRVFIIRFRTSLVAKNKKSRRGGTPEGVLPRRLTLQQTSRQSRVVFRLVIQRPPIIRHRMGKATIEPPPRYWIQSTARRPQGEIEAALCEEISRFEQDYMATSRMRWMAVDQRQRTHYLANTFDEAY